MSTHEHRTLSIAIGRLAQTGGSLSFSRSSTSDYRNGLNSAFRLCGVSSSALFTFSVLFFTKSAVAGDFTVLVLRPCCKKLPSDVFVLLIMISLSVVDLSVLVLLFGGEATYKSSILISSTSTAEL